MLQRIHRLTPETRAQWGKMDVGQIVRQGLDLYEAEG